MSVKKRKKKKNAVKSFRWKYLYSFYNGYAFGQQHPENYDYSDRARLIQQEIQSAKDYFIHQKNESDTVIDAELMKDLASIIVMVRRKEQKIMGDFGEKWKGRNQYATEEEILNIKTLKQAETFVDWTKKYSEDVGAVLGLEGLNNEKNMQRVQFALLMNDERFISHVAGNGPNILSYSNYGNAHSNLGGRTAGRDEFTGFFLNYGGFQETRGSKLAIKKKYGTQSKVPKKNRTFDFVTNEMEKSLEEKLQSKELKDRVWNLIRENINNSIVEVYNDKVGKNSSLNIKYEEAYKIFTTKSGEMTVKSFYKDMFEIYEDSLKDAFSKVGIKYDPEKFLNQSYYDGALEIKGRLRDNLFILEVTDKIYAGKKNKETDRFGSYDNTLITKEEVVKLLYNFLKEHINNYVGDDEDYEKAKTYINKGGAEVESLIERSMKIAYNKEMSKTGDAFSANKIAITQFAEFCKNGVRGFLLEMGVAVLVENGFTGYQAILTGKGRDEFGKQQTADIEFVSFSKKVKRFGIQVKNYSTDRIPLYTNKEIGLTEQNIAKYIDENTLRRLSFLISNEEFISSVLGDSLDRFALSESLQRYMPNFLRITRQDSSKKRFSTILECSFFYLNRKIFSSSYILAVMLQKIIMYYNNAEKRKQQDLLLRIEGKADKMVSPPLEGPFINMNGRTAREEVQPKAIVTKPNGVSFLHSPYKSIGNEETSKPNLVIDTLKNVKIVSKGLTIDIR